MRSVAVIVACVVALGVALDVGAQEASWEQRFHVDAPRKWQEYRELARRMRCDWESTERQLDGTSTVTRGDVVSYDEDYLQRWTATDGQMGVRARNASYAFELERKDDRALWFITRLTSDLSAAEVLAIRAQVDRALCRAICLETDLLPDWLLAEGFSVTDVKPASTPERTLVEVSFVNEPTERRANDIMYAGRMTLDPQAWWVIVSYEVELKSPSDQGTKSARIEYTRHDPEDAPWPARLVWTTHVAAAEDGQTGDVELSSKMDFAAASADRREFTLAAFGLPEPGGDERPPPGLPTWLWLAVGAAVLLGIGIVLVRRSRGAL